MFTIENPGQQSDADLTRFAEEVRKVAATLNSASFSEGAEEAVNCVVCILGCRSRGEPDCEACLNMLTPLKDRSPSDRMKEITTRGEWSEGLEDMILGGGGDYDPPKPSSRQQRRAAERARRKGRKQ